MSEIDHDAAFDAFMDADQLVMGLKAGDTLTEEGRAAITLVIEWLRTSDELATDAYSRGFQDGRRDAGGKKVAALLMKMDGLRGEVAFLKALNRLARKDANRPTPHQGPEGAGPVSRNHLNSEAFRREEAAMERRLDAEAAARPCRDRTQIVGRYGECLLCGVEQGEQRLVSLCPPLTTPKGDDHG
jgi:hypothetical protein